VDHIDAVLPGADDAQPAGGAPSEHPRHKMRVADAPDEMWAQRDRAKRGGVGGEDSRSHRFREWVKGSGSQW